MIPLKQHISNNILNFPGEKIEKKIIVIESDDWGAIRMPSKKIYNKLIDEGFRVDNNPYEMNDSLASEEDLSALFDVLIKHKDYKGNHPVITANCVMANPNFEAIRNNNFTQYYYELFTETLKRYPGCENSFKLWEQGYNENIFIPQSHGREHLNVRKWMNDLNTNKDIRHVFDYQIMGLFPKTEYKNRYQIAYEAKDDCINIITDGLELFNRVFHYRSSTFIAPCYTWRPSIEGKIKDKGVVGIQGMVYQFVPYGKSIRHWMGSKNEYGQIYTIRNCHFEPSTSKTKNEVEDCLFRIQCAFRWNKPAIISSHRVNFIGSINPSNRNRNLEDFDLLLSEIIKRWPDVEFMSSDKLVEHYSCIK